MNSWGNGTPKYIPIQESVNFSINHQCLHLRACCSNIRNTIEVFSTFSANVFFICHHKVFPRFKNQVSVQVIVGFFFITFFLDFTIIFIPPLNCFDLDSFKIKNFVKSTSVKVELAFLHRTFSKTVQRQSNLLKVTWKFIKDGSSFKFLRPVLF